jgi:uncharacterized repeat protein (TIGR01451 family)
MWTSPIERRRRGAPPPNRRAFPVGRSTFPVLAVVAVLVASLAGFGLVRANGSADAADIPGAITGVSVREDTVGYWGSMHVDLNWSVPDSAQAGDTFTFTLPAALDELTTGFQLKAPDGQVVANASFSGGVVTFTLTSYADTYHQVAGTAWFEATWDHSVVDGGETVHLEFPTSTTVFTDDVAVPGVGGVNRDQPRKYGYWTNQADQGHTLPDGALAWGLESTLGPWDTVRFQDAPDGGHVIDCTTVWISFGTTFDPVTNEVTHWESVDPSTYQLSCSATAIDLSVGPVPAGQVVHLDYRTTITDQTAASYKNDALITEDGKATPVSANPKRSDAGGDGSGTVTPGIDIEKFGTEAGPVDGDADAAPGQEVGASTTPVTLRVTNSGNEPLVDVVVSDATGSGPALTGLTCDFSALGGPSSGLSWAGPFAVDASFDCTGTLPKLAGGEAHADTAAVSATGATSHTEVRDDDPWHAHNPSVFDLALRKTLAAGQASEVTPRSVVHFDVEVFNQGNVTATDIEVTDTLPPGTTLADDTWTDSGDGTATRTIAGPLAPGASTHVPIAVRLGASVPGGILTNHAEISAADDGDGNPATDVDSQPDTTPTNDVLDDDVIDETPATGDEDDHDIAEVTVDAPVFDLALRKTTEADVVQVGDTVPFTITVFNQGNLAATDIAVADELPEQLAFHAEDNPGWDLVDGVPTTIVPGPLAPGASTEVTINLEVVHHAARIDNLAEISSATGPDGETVTDVDSTPDANPDDDALIDDVIDQTPATGDEDDHDIASIRAPEFDLALRKTLADGQSSTVWPGDDATFTIEVFNQGDQAAHDIVVTDTPPEGTAFDPADNPGWTVVDGKPTTTVAGPLAPGESTTVTIVLSVDADRGPGALVNDAEISAALDETGQPGQDVDSTPDRDASNDELTDDVIDSTPDGTPADEDDHDVAEIDVPRFDLALRKTLAEGQASTVRPGDDVAFTVTVFNQGTIAAANVAVADTLPEGLGFDADANPDWTYADGVASTTVAGPIAPGDHVSIDLHLVVGEQPPHQLVNNAEITGATDDGGTPRTDVDSTPDGDATNDDLIDDEIAKTPATGDEDDHDIAEIVTEQIEDETETPTTTTTTSPTATPSTTVPSGSNHSSRSTSTGSGTPGWGTLPRTGADLAGLATAGGVLVLAGAATLRGRRRRAA